MGHADPAAYTPDFVATDALDNLAAGVLFRFRPVIIGEDGAMLGGLPQDRIPRLGYGGVETNGRALAYAAAEIADGGACFLVMTPGNDEPFDIGVQFDFLGGVHGALLPAHRD